VQARGNLRLNPLTQSVFFEAGEVRVQQVGAILLERLFHALPRQSVVARNALAGQILNLSWSDIVGVKLHSRQLIGSGCSQA
jgi:hypothetical protein